MSTAAAAESDRIAVDGADRHISVEHLSKVFEAGGNPVHALHDISLTVRPGEFVTLLGPSGCGKSTLLRIIAGLTPPTDGDVLIAGARPDQAQRAKRIGMVFQQAALLPWRNVTSNVRLPLEVNKRDGGPATSARAIPDLLQLVGLADFARAYPFQLSGGMQQRVAIARALIFDPEILLMDEPFGALDEITRDQMRYELLRIWGASRKTVVFVTHSIPEAIILSDRIVVMSSRPGQVREVLDVHLPRPRGEELEMSPEFLSMADHLRRQLRPAAGTAGQ